MPFNDDNDSSIMKQQQPYHAWIDVLLDKVRRSSYSFDASNEGSLRHYFEQAISRGIRFDGNQPHSFEQLGAMDADELKQAETQLHDKLKQGSRNNFTDAATKRSEQARWDSLFAEGENEIYLPLDAEAHSLDDRISHASEKVDAPLTSTKSGLSGTQGGFIAPSVFSQVKVHRSGAEADKATHIKTDQESYHSWLNILMKKVKEHRPNLERKQETGLLQYFEKAISYGIRFDGSQPHSFDQLVNMSASELVAAAKELNDKLTPESRKNFAEAAQKRSPQAQWDSLFPAGKDDIVLELDGTNAQSLDSRIDEVIAKHNKEATHSLSQAKTGVEKPKTPETFQARVGKLRSLMNQVENKEALAGALEHIVGTNCYSDNGSGFDHKKLGAAITQVFGGEAGGVDTFISTLTEKMGGDYPDKLKLFGTAQVGKDVSQRQIRRDPENKAMLQSFDEAKQKWDSYKSLGSFLEEKYEWNLGKHFQIENGRTPAQNASNFDSNIANRDTPLFGGLRPDNYNLNDLQVVISRNPQKIGEMSSGQLWRSCMAEDGINFHYVPSDIEGGTLVAYLVSKDDPQARYPLMRQLLKPFVSESGEVILASAKVYPHEENASGTADALQKTLGSFVRERVNDNAKGEFSMRSGLYADGQATTAILGMEWTNDNIKSALKNFHIGLVQELGAELEIARQKIISHFVPKIVPWGSPEERQEAEEQVRKLEGKIARMANPKELAKEFFTEQQKMGLGSLPEPKNVLEVANTEEIKIQLRGIDDLLKKDLKPWASDFLKDADKFINEDYAETIVRFVAKKSPEQALKYANKYADKPYTKEIIGDALKEDPRIVLKYANKYIGQDWSDEMLKSAVDATAEKYPLSISETTLLMSAVRYADKPYAETIIRDSMKKNLSLTMSWADKFADQSWAEAVIKDVATQDPYQALQCVSHYKNQPYAEAIIRDLAAQFPEEMLSGFYRKNLDKLSYSGELLENVARKSAGQYPRSAIINADKFADKPYAAEVLKIAAKQEPELALKYASKKFGNQPYHAEVVEVAKISQHFSAPHINAASNGVGVAMAAYNIGNKFIGADATYNNDQKAGGKQAAFANASLVADSAMLATSATAMTADVLLARKSKDTASQAVSSSVNAAQATANSAQATAQQAADAMKKALEETGKHSAELEKAAAGALAEAGEATIIAGRLSKLSKTLGPLGIGLAGVSGGFQYKAASEAGDGYRAASAIGGTSGGIIGGIALGAGLGFAAGLPVFGVGAIGGAAIGAVGGLIGGFGGAMLGDHLAKHFFGENLQLAFNKEQQEKLKPQMEALAKISQKFQQNEDVFTNVMQISAAYEQAQKSGDKVAVDKAANALIHAQSELEKLPKPTDAETKQMQALQGTLAVAMVNQKAMEHPAADIIKQLQTAMNTTNAILSASAALHDATKQEVANNNQISKNNKVSAGYSVG